MIFTSAVAESTTASTAKQADRCLSPHQPKGLQRYQLSFKYHRHKNGRAGCSPRVPICELKNKGGIQREDTSRHKHASILLIRGEKSTTSRSLASKIDVALECPLLEARLLDGVHPQDSSSPVIYNHRGNVWSYPPRGCSACCCIPGSSLTTCSCSVNL